MHPRAPHPAYEVVHGTNVIALGERLLIGRGPECNLRLLHDPLVSRAHVRLTVCAHGVVVEDLGTRNGTVIDGAVMHGSRLFTGNHTLLVGNTEVRLRLREAAAHPCDARKHDDDTAPPRSVTPEGGPPLPKALFEMAATVAIHRAQANDPARAEEVAAPHLVRLLRDAQRGLAVHAPHLSIATDVAFALATTTRRAHWLEYVVELHLACDQVLSTESILQLARIARTLTDLKPHTLLSYCAHVRKAQPQLHDEARRHLDTLENLVPRSVAG